MRKTAAALAIILLCSCNSGGSSDKEKQAKELNEQSLKCIGLMNTLQSQKDAALASGDATGAEALGRRIDSAATENAKIGQKLMELQDQK